MDLSLPSLTLQACTGNDWISELPDDILIHILSYLIMKEAGRTSSLSKRWRHVWTNIRNLDFDGSDTLDELDYEELEEIEPSYSLWVDQVANLHRALTIDEFKVKYELGASRNDKIDNWLVFAMEKRVKRLELDVGNGNPLFYTFPSVPFCNSLTSLQLTDVHVCGELLEELLSNCQALEFLSVRSSKLLVNFKVVGPCLNLKSLTILYCFEIKHLEISAPNLQFFCYSGPKISSPFKNIPKLAKLTIGGAYATHLMSDFHDISSFISQIEELALRPLDVIECMLEVFPVCARLRMLDIKLHLGCDVQLFRLRFLLNACPLLHKFVLLFYVGLRTIVQTKKTRNVKAYPHHQLRILEIDEFHGSKVDMAFVSYLIESAVSLEKITIGPAFNVDGNGRKRKAIQKAEKLRSKLKPGAVLQIRE